MKYTLVSLSCLLAMLLNAAAKYSLTIDRNEFFNDSVTVQSSAEPDANGKYEAGTTITLTAVPGTTGTFKKWYGDVPKESRELSTVSFTVTGDTWIYARFVHPWTLSADKATMTDGNFTVNVTDANESTHTLTVGKVEALGLLSEGDAGSGIIDLGGAILLAGDETPWTITKFAPTKGTQVVSASRQ